MMSERAKLVSVAFTDGSEGSFGRSLMEGDLVYWIEDGLLYVEEGNSLFAVVLANVYSLLIEPAEGEELG